MNDELQTLQRDMQRMLGRCILLLQQYEKLMKAILINHEIRVFGLPPKSDVEKRIASLSFVTLGNLIGKLLSTFVTSNEMEDTAKPELPDNIISINIKMGLRISADDYDKMRIDLEELVLLRNKLVHHFIDQYDLWDLDGCRDAYDGLTTAYSRIHHHFEQLRSWARHIDQTRRRLAEFMQSDDYLNILINGRAPHDWSMTGIVQALQQAAENLAVEGWTSLDLAQQWIIERHPNQLPAMYGCRSWQQVVHESRLFELRYLEITGKRAAWYRTKKI